MNDFFFEIMEEPLASFFGQKPGPDFRKIADPIQLWVTAILLYFISSVQKMSALKGEIFPQKNPFSNFP